MAQIIDFPSQSAAIGTQAQKPLPTLSDEQKKKIETGLAWMFFGLTWNIWMSGKTLGAAWTEAYSMVKSFADGKAKAGRNNPAAQYMALAIQKRLGNFLKLAMTSPHKEQKMDVPEKDRAKWHEIGTKWLNQGRDQVNEVVKAAQPKETETAGQTQTPLTREQYRDMVMAEHLRQKRMIEELNRQRQHAA